MIRALTSLAIVVCCFSATMFGATGSKNVSDRSQTTAARIDTSAPDTWGYTYVKSTDLGGPTFNWVDITPRGTLATGLGDDNSVGPLPILFSFQYYWYQVTQFRIGSNGYITFGNQTANFASPFAQLPALAAPNDMLAPLAGDLDFTDTAAHPKCYYWSNGSDSLVVSYINVPEWRTTADPNTKHTFQVILNKQDSSITYQYLKQQGLFNDANNMTLCIGMENQTGQIGLNYLFTAAPPGASMPDSGLAIKFKRTINTGLQVTDAGIVGGFNVENLAPIILQGQSDTIKTIVRNFGTADLSNVRVTYSITKSGQPTLRDTVFISTLNTGNQVTVTFARTFTPAVTGSYAAAFTTFVTGDVGPANNSKTTEILSAAFSTSASTRLAFEGGTVAGNVNWTGGGGMAVDFEVPVARVRIESVYVNIAAVTLAPMIVEIRDGSTGVPGTLLGTKTVNATVSNNGVSFVSDSIRVTTGRFFVGAQGQMAFNYETTAPISYRTWEYTNGYAPYRSRDLQDVMIRAVVRQEVLVGVEETPGLPERITLSQNYPNPFNPSTRINYTLPEQAKVRLAIFDILGREIKVLVGNETMPAGEYQAEWNGANNQGITMPSGTYFIRLESGAYTETKKLLLLK